MPPMTGARYLAETLQGYGVTHVFFVPAMLSHTLAEMERSTDIKRILVHSEIAAAYMADGYARVTGRPGVCMSQHIGSSNLAAGLRDAYMGCSPIVAFSGGPVEKTRNRRVYQQIDDSPQFKQVTKWSTRVAKLENLPVAIRQAFRTATTGTPRPVHIEIAGHLGQLEQETAALMPSAEPAFGQTPALRTPPQLQALKEAVHRLEKAKRPVIVAGGGARYSGAGSELIQLAELLSIPVATSMNAKELIPSTHPLAIGVPGQYCRQSANWALLEADLVFYVGSQIGSQVTFQWQVPPPDVPVIQLDIDPEALSHHYSKKLTLLGDAKLTLSRLIDLCSGGTAPLRRPWVQRVQQLAQAWRDEFDPRLHSDAVPIRPERLCHELSQHLPPDAIVVSDTGHAGMWTAGLLDLNKPNQSYIRAAGSLGWGLPAALGAKLAAPQRPVLLFIGDGGLWYHIAELETAVRWNIPLVILVNNNNAFSQVVEECRGAFHGKLEGRHGELWQFKQVDVVALAETIGCKGIRVTRPNELPGAIARAFVAGGPCVVDVQTDVSILAPLASALAHR